MKKFIFIFAIVAVTISTDLPFASAQGVPTPGSGTVPAPQPGPVPRPPKDPPTPPPIAAPTETPAETLNRGPLPHPPPPMRSGTRATDCTLLKNKSLAECRKP